MLQTENFPFYLSPNGKYVNMGSFEEMVLDRKHGEILSVPDGFFHTYTMDVFDIALTAE